MRSSMLTRCRSVNKQTNDNPRVSLADERSQTNAVGLLFMFSLF
jgi:hypothetical protein